MREVTEAMIQAIRKATLKTGEKCSSMKELSEHLHVVTYHSLSQICSRKRKRIKDNAVEDLSDQVQGFAESLEVKELQPVKGINSKLIARLQELTKERLEADEGEGGRINDGCLSVVTKIDVQELGNFSTGKFMLSPFQLICLILEFEHHLPGFKRGREWKKMCEVYKAELDIAPYILSNFKCDLYEFNLTNEERLNHEDFCKHKRGVVYNAPCSGLDMCFGDRFNQKYFSRQIIDEPLSSERGEYLVFMKRNRVIVYDHDGKKNTKGVHKKIMGRAKIDSREGVIVFDPVDFNKDNQLKLKFMLAFNEKNNLDLQNYSELKEELKDVELNFSFIEEHVSGPKVHVKITKDFQGVLLVERKVSLSDLEALYKQH